MPRYRIYCTEDERDALPNSLRIVESYAGFVIATGSQQVVETLRRRFPIEQLATTRRRAAGSTAGARAAAAPAAPHADGGDMVVRFDLPMKEEWLQELSKYGFDVSSAFGPSAVVGRCRNKRALERVAGHPAVARVDPFVPTVKLSPAFYQGLGLTATERSVGDAAVRLANRKKKFKRPAGRQSPVPGEVVAVFSSKSDRTRAETALKREGLTVSRSTDRRTIVNLLGARDAAGAVQMILGQRGLLRIEEKRVNRQSNDVARRVIGTDVVTNPAALLTGEGEIVAVCDTGIDTGDAGTIHLDFHGRVVDILSYPNGLSAVHVTNPGADDGPADVYSGHGTHIAGSVLGNGAQAVALNIAPIAGLATHARLVFQAVEQTPHWTLAAQQYFLSRGQVPPQSGLFGIPDDLTVLFQDAYDRGARIHTNSWGGGAPGEYDSQCEDLDEFMWENKDFFVLVAAGNAGVDAPTSSAGINVGSVDSPGTAKNCLTVGASENDRSGEFGTTYGQAWPDDYPRDPFFSDGMVDSIDDVVAFSSRGPCTTGRRKPDVVAPGTYILSTRSSRIPNNNFAWAAFPPAKPYYMYNSGTSMATPLVAGAAAVVREFLRKLVGYQNPSAALLKASLIHCAQYRAYRYAHASSSRWADNEQGWGRVDLREALLPPDGREVYFIDYSAGLSTGDVVEADVEVVDDSTPLRVTMTYTDYPGEHLVNNLNLILIAPNGEFHAGNDFDRTGVPDSVNNVEGVVVERPALGNWTIRAVASDVLQGRQDFAVVVSGHLS